MKQPIEVLQFGDSDMFACARCGATLNKDGSGHHKGCIYARNPEPNEDGVETASVISEHCEIVLKLEIALPLTRDVETPASIMFIGCGMYEIKFWPK